ncbi:MAG: DUF4124 domain-containing protein [Chromatiaceae bacterium]
MPVFERISVLSAVLLFSVLAFAGGPVYKSVDESGHASYSSEPPEGAEKVEGIQLPSGPSEEETKESLERAKEMENEADARYDAVIERRRLEAEARNEAQEDAEAAKRSRPGEESTDSAEPSLEELRQRCQEARERKIAPLRAQAIEECISANRSTRTREDCERIYHDLGEGGRTVTGAYRPEMFNDLPECVEYFRAQDRERYRGGSAH